MKKILFVCLILLFSSVQGISAKEEVLIFHYPLYYFSPDKTTDLKKVQELAAGIEKLINARFSGVKGEQKGKAVVGGVTYLGEINPKDLEVLFNDKYPAIVIAEAATSPEIVRIAEALKRPPMVLVLLNLKKGSSISIPPDTAKVINIFGLTDPDHFELKVTDKNREFNIGIKGEEKVGLFASPKMAAFTRDLLYSALMDAIRSNRFRYGN